MFFYFLIRDGYSRFLYVEILVSSELNFGLHYHDDGINHTAVILDIDILCVLESDEIVLQTDGVYLDKQVLVRRRSAVDSDSCVPFPQARLLGDTVWIPEGSPVRGRIDNLARESGGEIYVVEVPKATPEHLTILTALGELRQAVVNESVARHIAADYPDLDISTPLSFNQLQSWAVAPGDSVLADSLDSWLGAFRETPKYKALLKKYLE